MESIARPRIVIAGTNSGVGKTTIVTGLLSLIFIPRDMLYSLSK